MAEQEPRPGAERAAHGRSPARVIFTPIIAAMGEMKAIRGEGGETNGRIPDFWFRARGARKCVGLRQESLKDPRSDSVQGFYACGAEPEPCLASPLPLRSDSGVEPQSRWWGGRGGGAQHRVREERALILLQPRQSLNLIIRLFVTVRL